MSCCPKPDEQPWLFDDVDEKQRSPGRRNPSRKPVSRQKEVQVHLPVLQGVDAELQRMEDLAATQRPTKRGDCEQEARPCPWVVCPHHVYFERFEEFEAIIDAFPEPDEDADIEEGVRSTLVGLFEQGEGELNDRARRPQTQDAVAATAAEGRAMITVEKRGGGVRSDVLTTPDIRGPWPTCSLDIADDVAQADAQLSEEDTARILDVSREAVRQIEDRVKPHLAASEGLRPWLEELVSEEQLDHLASTVAPTLDWFGD